MSWPYVSLGWSPITIAGADLHSFWSMAMRLNLLGGSICALLSAALFLPLARGDGMVYRLPPDGAFVKYDLKANISFAGGQEIAIGGSLTISSVGEATVDGKKCRWIEFKTVFKIGAQETPNVSSLLVSENLLGQGKSAAGKAIRARIKSGDGEIHEIAGSDAPNLLIENAMLLCGPPKIAGELKPAEIENVRLGKSTCGGVTGEFDVERAPGKNIHLKFEKRLHDMVPFGVVSAGWKFEAKNDGQLDATGAISLTLTEMGTAAVSELSKEVRPPEAARLQADLAAGGAEFSRPESPEKLELLRRRVDENQQDAEARRAYGQALQNAGEDQAAYKQFSALAKLEPQSLIAESKLVQLCTALKRAAECDEHLAKVRQIYKDQKTRQPWFCREQFAVGGKHVAALEYFELSGPMALQYRFEVREQEGETSLYRITLGSYDFTTKAFRELGKIKENERVFHLDSYAGRDHGTYAFLGVKSPSYEQTRQLVVEIIEGRRSPLSGSRLPEK